MRGSRTITLVIIILLSTCGLLLSVLSICLGNSSIYDFLLNFGTELIGALVTFVLIDRFLNKREQTEESLVEEASYKNKLIIEMGSASNTNALYAVDTLRAKGWLFDKTLEHSSFVEADLSNSNLTDAYLKYTNFSEAKLENATLIKANLAFSSLSGAKMKNSKLRYADLQEASLTAANLVASDLRDANLEKAQLAFTDLTGALLQGANLKGVTLFKTTGLDGAKCDERTVLPNGELWYPNLDWNIFYLDKKEP